MTIDAEELRRLHVPFGSEYRPVCFRDGADWPCPVIELLDERDELMKVGMSAVRLAIRDLRGKQP